MSKSGNVKAGLSTLVEIFKLPSRAAMQVR